jgi:hypothetical protein
MASRQDMSDRIIGVWGPRAYSWSGEAGQRVLGFAYDQSGHQRVLGFPPDSPEPLSYHWLRALARRHPCWPRRPRAGRMARPAVSCPAGCCR